jgi:toxin ParE1/3/4
MSRYQLSATAQRDVAAILRETTQLFGTRQRDRYASILRIGVEMVASEPNRPGSRPRDDIANGIRSFHLELAAGRSGAAVHQIFYIKHVFDSGEESVIILRILHERMEPSRHVLRSNL